MRELDIDGVEFGGTCLRLWVVSSLDFGEMRRA
jgi:hypothetical protein